MRHTRIETALGELILVADGDAIVGLYFPDHWYGSAGGDFGPRPDGGDDLLDRAAAQLGEYLAGERESFDLPLEGRGDDFERRVWRLIDAIPYGATTTYGSIATELGDPSQARRVGQAVGHNPLSILVPCHRVVGADGGLTGYAGGIERKRFLLELEEPEPEQRGRLF
ncbi:MAG: methylated-DNA--[protein]-cysteine S-methyltransferase [Solirubrobacterales bacterium]|nr:methylated-DNA--[protein]-cysteine S-methyltransferase [Solirubrobacterales bacterium]MCO5326002.1 methylated-DNA--[protein]-cysteine S-methyltransferase [Solirubrobacterales bacterium]